VPVQEWKSITLDEVHAETLLRLVERKALPRAQLRARQDNERDAAGDRWIDSGLVFTTLEGRGLDGTAITKRFQDHLKKAGLPRRRFHDLRHSCATLLLVQGVSPRVVMDVLGHSQIGLTMNTYSHVIPDLRRDAAQRMDDLIAERD
jgi:integrase